MSTERRPESIGAELIEASRNLDVSSLPLSTRLFPYIFVAARRMSLRTMSTWLQEKHGVSLSPAAISRALASPKMHLERLAQSIAAPTRYVAEAYGFDPMALLYDTVVENGPSELEILAKENPQPDGEDDIYRWSELQDLAAIWEPMPHEVQLILRPYFESEFGDSDDVIHQSNDNDF
jgi:hypothetical protein